MMNVLLNLAHSDNVGLMYYDTSEPKYCFLSINIYIFVFCK